jgi:hypothetical protein
MNQIIELTEDIIIVRTAEPRRLGADIDLKVKFPKGASAKHLVIPGTVTGCKFVNNQGNSHYLLEMKIGELPQVDQDILHAYRDYLERKKVLSAANVDLGEIQEAFESLGRNLMQLRETAEQLRNNLRGTLELMKVKAEGKTTIH